MPTVLSGAPGAWPRIALSGPHHTIGSQMSLHVRGWSDETVCCGERFRTQGPLKIFNEIGCFDEAAGI